MLLGSDSTGKTDISLRNLEAIRDDGYSLREIHIRCKCPNETKCTFIFDDDDTYEASGFSIGYGGTGPHGLWRAIKMFEPDKIETDFWETPIYKMKFGNWKWKPDKGFIRD